MRSLAWGIALLLAACVDEPGIDDEYPVLPGGGTVAGSTTPSGGGSGSGTGKTYRVCKLMDVRDLTSCQASGAGGYRVQLGAAIAGTQDNGSFTIDPSMGPGNHFVVTGTGIVKSLIPFGFVSALPIPIITEAAYTDMQNATGALPVAGHGAIMARATNADGSSIFVGAKGSTAPAAMYEVRYDGATQVDWVTGTGSGPFGGIWAPGVPVGTATLVVADPNNVLSGGSTGLQVEDNAITFFPAMLM